MSVQLPRLPSYCQGIRGPIRQTALEIAGKALTMASLRPKLGGLTKIGWVGLELAGRDVKHGATAALELQVHT